ncbi:MAG: hypothetical protein AAGD28_09805, partial [Bacteroidota bacterium]
LPIFTSLDPLLKIYLFSEVFDASIDEELKDNGMIKEATLSRRVHELRLMSHALDEFVTTNEYPQEYMGYAREMIDFLQEIDSISLYERLNFIDSEPEQLGDLNTDTKAMLYAAQFFVKNEDIAKARDMLNRIPNKDRKQISLHNKVEVIGYQIDDMMQLAQSSDLKEFSDAIELLEREKRIAISGRKGRSVQGNTITYYFGDYFTTKGVVLDKNLYPISNASILFWDWGDFFSSQGDLNQQAILSDESGRFEIKSHSLRLKVEAEGFASQIITIENPDEMQLIVLDRTDTQE